MYYEGKGVDALHFGTAIEVLMSLPPLVRLRRKLKPFRLSFRLSSNTARVWSHDTLAGVLRRAPRVLRDIGVLDTLSRVLPYKGTVSIKYHYIEYFSAVNIKCNRRYLWLAYY